MPAGKCTARSLMWPTAVIITLPPLPVIITAACTISSVTTPGVMITWSARWPQVVSTTKSCACLAVANACVAPNTVVAISRLNSTGSTTTTFFAPANLAPCTALLPTPPAPKITTVSPARTSAACTAEPQPVGTPQPVRHRTSHGMSWKSSRRGTAAHSEMTAYWEKVPSVQKPPRSSSPRWNRHVPSSNMPVPAFSPFTHMFECPVEHGRQAPQAGMYEQMILSPGLTRCTSGPTDSTMPAPSCPPTTGSLMGASPVVMWSSEWQSPAAISLTRTSCAFGSSSCRSTISQPTCGARAIAARVVMLIVCASFPERVLVLVDDHAADVLAVEHVLVALVDLVQLVPASDQLVQLELARLVQADQERHVDQGAPTAVDRALDLAPVAEQHAGVLVDHAPPDRGDRDLAGLADDLDGVLDHLVVQDADGDDRAVGELAPGGLADEVEGLLGGGEGVRGAEHLGHLPLELHRVDHDHVLRPGEPRALHRVAAHPAGAVDHHGVAGAHVAGPYRRAPAGRHPAGHQRRDVEADPLGDLDDGELVHHRVLRERAEHAQAAEVLAALVEPERAVREHPGRGVLAGVAQVLAAGRAVPALAAGGDERAGHVVADGNPGDGITHRVHDARALVPADNRHPHRRVALLDVVVGVAQAGRVELDPDLVRLRVIELKLGDLPRLAGFPADRGSRCHAHGYPFPGSA